MTSLNITNVGELALSKGISKRVWVSLETHRRNQTTSKALGATLFEIEYKTNQLMRYIRATVKTLFILFIERPTLIFARLLENLKRHGHVQPHFVGQCSMTSSSGSLTTDLWRTRLSRFPKIALENHVWQICFMPCQVRLEC